ncbi:MAG: dienelactone hydrolase [Rickettsiaceae bacterium]|jgi:dienelactone hydrolase|nr:dienelactone hydrolase [Rickettsiaceae bacterium]
MRFIVTFILLSLISLSSSAAIITKNIDYKDGDVNLRGVLAYDDAISSPQPAVLVVPEWWGQNEYIKKRTIDMASKGYIAFSPDMYGVDKVTTDPKVATEWSKPFYENRDMMRKRAKAGLEVLLKQKNVDKKNVAAIGFCMGGTVTLELARSGEDLKGVAAFHAGLQFPEKVEKGKVKAKVLVLNGGADPMVPAEEREKFIEEMQTSGADLQFMQYGGAVHAFTNPNADSFKIPGVSYDENAEKRSFLLLNSFFKEIFEK